MSIKVAVVMDDIATITVEKDSTFAMLLEAQRRQWVVYYCQQQDLYCRDGIPYARLYPIKVMDNAQHWFDCGEPSIYPLSGLDVILMRKDPPFNIEYIYTTYLLELAERAGVLIVNRPQALRDANEKFFTSWFPQCCPPTLVSRDRTLFKAFFNEFQDIVIKPLEGMGGSQVFRVQKGDPNFNVIIETLSQHGTKTIMAQRFIPEITEGDKRILLIDGEPVPYALARIPAAGETRANLAAGGKGVGISLSKRDYWICEQIAPTLRAKGLLFVGIDIIGDYLTEINITSPTCVRQLDKLYNLNISALLLNKIEGMQSQRSAPL